MEGQPKPTSAAAVVIAGIILPGWGYWLLGEKKRAILAGGGILLMFLLGIFIAGVRVVNLPGYEDGYKKYVEAHRYGENRVYFVPTTRPAVAVEPSPARDATGRPQWTVKRLEADGRLSEENTYDPPLWSKWVLLNTPFAVIGDNLWFLGQVLTGPTCAITGYISNEVARAGVDRSYGRLADIGALYTAVAGMMNLMIIVDTVARAGRKEARQ